jgi:Rps23 Pro-64 3,4-dihydroxylase Tpa1-like proline 4-hydroxylase
MCSCRDVADFEGGYLALWKKQQANITARADSSAQLVIKFVSMIEPS